MSQPPSSRETGGDKAAQLFQGVPIPGVIRHTRAKTLAATFMLLTAALCEPAAGQEEAQPEPQIIIQRNVDCASVGVDAAAFKNWRIVSSQPIAGAVKYHANTVSTVGFDVTLPPGVIVNLRYRAGLLWQRTYPSRENFDGEAMFMSGDAAPLTVPVKHQDFFKIEKMEVTALTCNAVSVIVPPPPSCPECPICEAPAEEGKAAPVPAAPGAQEPVLDEEGFEVLQ